MKIEMVLCMAKTTVILQSRLPLAECKARLANAVDIQRFAFNLSGLAGSRGVVGKFHDCTFRLRKRRFYHNHFAPYFYGRFLPAEAGTILAIRVLALPSGAL